MRGLIAIVLGLTLSQSSYAIEGGESRVQAGSPNARKWGTYVGIGNPYPSLLGLNVAYNVDSHIRASIGYGEIEVTSGITFDGNGISEQKTKASTYSAGADYLITDYQVRPLVGLRAGYFNVSGNGTFNVQGVSRSTGLLYTNIGLDWLAGGGFNMGAGLNVAMLGGAGANFYANLGYFF